MTYAISKHRHATLAHFKIDMEITKLVTRDGGFNMRHWGPPVKGPRAAPTTSRPPYLLTYIGGGGGGGEGGEGGGGGS